MAEKKLDQKIGLYCEIYNRLYETISKVNPEHAVEISTVIFQEIAKDLRSEQISEMRAKGMSEQTTEGEDLATTKQREALHKFGVKDIPESISKREASEILDRLVGFSKDGDSQSIAKFVEELNAKWKKSQ
jgi:hypothetical protein